MSTHSSAGELQPLPKETPTSTKQPAAYTEEFSEPSSCSDDDDIINLRPRKKREPKPTPSTRKDNSDSDDEQLAQVVLPTSAVGLPKESSARVVGFAPDHSTPIGSSKREPPGTTYFGVLSEALMGNCDLQMLQDYLRIFISPCKPMHPGYAQHDVFADITQPHKEKPPAENTCAFSLKANVKSEADIEASKSLFNKLGVQPFQAWLIEEGQTSGNLISNSYGNYLVSDDVVDGMRPGRNYHTRDVNWIREGEDFDFLLDFSTLDVSGGDGSSRATTLEAVAGKFLCPGIMKNMQRLRINQLTAVQSAVLYLMTKKTGYDIICQAEAGCGKSAIFVIALVAWIYNFKKGQERKNIKEKNWKHPKHSPYAVIIVPNRELAAQISCFANELTKGMPDKVSVAASYGEMPIATARRHLTNGCDILVGTAARLLSHFQCDYLKMTNLFWTVLDETDEILRSRNECESSIDELLAMIKFEKKTRMYAFSGSFSLEVVTELKTKFMRPDPFEIKSRACPTTIAHYFVELETHTKRTFLQNLLRVLQNGGHETPKTIIFVENQAKCEFIYNLLHYTGFPCFMFHKSMFQHAREYVLHEFAFGKARILVTTEIGSRGLNFKDVKYVINYDFPEEPEHYFNRAGRTGRLGNIGTVITFFELGRQQEILRINLLVPALNEAGLRPASLLYYYYTGGPAPTDVLKDLAVVEKAMEELENCVYGCNEQFDQEMQDAAATLKKEEEEQQEGEDEEQQAEEEEK